MRPIHRPRQTLRPILSGLALVAALAPIASAQETTQDRLRIEVPDRSDAAPLGGLKVMLDLGAEGRTAEPLDFHVTIFAGPDRQPMMNGRLRIEDGTVDCIGNQRRTSSRCGFWFGAMPALDERGREIALEVVPPDRADERDTRYALFIRPEVGIDLDDCASRMTGDEIVEVSVTGARIHGACLQTFDHVVEDGRCLDGMRPGDPLFGPTWPRYVDLPDQVMHTPTHSCAGWRPPLDVAMCLDVSGSMRASFAPGDGRSRLAVAKEVIEQFGSSWASLHRAESVDGGAWVDEVGLVAFNGDALITDQTTLIEAARLFDIAADDESTFGDLVEDLEASGMTSIGDGISAAVGARLLDLSEGRAIEPPTRRNVILLLSDGKTNRATHLRAIIDETEGPDGPSVVSRIEVAGDDRRYAALGDQDVDPALDRLLSHDGEGFDAQIYTITIGAGAGNIDARVMDNLARATGGAYFHVDTVGAPSSDRMGRVLTNVLQNLLQFNTWRVVRRIETRLVGYSNTFDVEGVHPDDWQGASTRFHVPGTAHAVSIVAQYDPAPNGDAPADGQLTLRLKPPPGIEAPEPVTGNGRVTLTMPLPRGAAAPARLGEWALEVDQHDGFEPMPLSITILADTLGVDARTRVLAKDVAVGEEVVVETRLTALGAPVTALGGGLVWLNVKGPVLALGERMSDPMHAAALERALDGARTGADVGNRQNILRDALAELEPDAYGRTWTAIVMTDDGRGADRIAGDGIYTARFVPLRTGNFEVATSVLGRRHRAVGAFEFQHNETLFARDEPALLRWNDDGRPAIDWQVNDSPRGEGRTRHVAYTPHNVAGDRLGPGYEGALFVERIDGRIEPLADKDLDGTYEATFEMGPAEVQSEAEAIAEAAARAADDGPKGDYAPGPDGEPIPPLRWVDHPAPVYADDDDAVLVELGEEAARRGRLAPVPLARPLTVDADGFPDGDGFGEGDPFPWDQAPPDEGGGSEAGPDGIGEPLDEGDGGCDCRAADAPGGSALALLAVVGLGLLRRRRG